MNNVSIRINSYAQTAQIHINGSEPSPYSELSNYTYEQFIKTPDLILDALARELNDDFVLDVCGNSYECGLFEAAAQKSTYCSSFTASEPALQIPSTERAQRLGISLSSMGNIPADLSEAACETLFINPEIGRAVARLSNPTPEQAICARVTPILTASLPSAMEVGEAAQVSVEVYPEACNAPSVVVQSSNPDVLSAEGTTLRPLAAGNAIVHVFVAGENRPFFSQNVAVSKTVNVTKIEILDMDEPLREGAKTPLQATLLPRDADDLSSLTWTSSDPAIVEIVDGVAIPKALGACVITASTTNATCSKSVVVLSKLKGLKLSQSTVTINVGRKEPITVSLDPPMAYDASYRWSSSDETVAIVVKENGAEYIKAVGIGSCKLTCISESGACTDTCAVTVESIMYKRTAKKKSKAPIIVVIAVIAVAVLLGSRMIGTDASEPSDLDVPDQVQEQEQDASTPVEGGTAIDFELPEGDLLEPPIAMVSKIALDSATAKVAEFQELGYEKILLEPQVVSAYFLKATDPEYPHKDYGLNIEFHNAIGVVVHYHIAMGSGGTMEHDFWTLYLFPDCYYDSDGNVQYASEKHCAFPVSPEGDKPTVSEIQSGFYDMTVSEISFSYLY